MKSFLNGLCLASTLLLCTSALAVETLDVAKANSSEMMKGRKTVTVYAGSESEAMKTAEVENSGWTARKVKKIGNSKSRMYQVTMEK